MVVIDRAIPSELPLEGAREMRATPKKPHAGAGASAVCVVQVAPALRAKPAASAAAELSNDARSWEATYSVIWQSRYRQTPAAIHAAGCEIRSILRSAWPGRESNVT
jgi:hypothetical protein